jgi:pyridoxal phosphate enzyme (YggS family)
MSVVERYCSVQQRVRAAAQRSGRKPEDIQLIAVSKRQPDECVQELIVGLNEMQQQVALGENYVQEFKQKKIGLTGDFQAHLIGPLQSNKARDAVSLFEVIQSVHSQKILSALNKESGKQGGVQQVYLQVNISQDLEKSGFSPEELLEVVQDFSRFEHLVLEGLMTITRFYDEPELARPDFQKMFLLSQRVQETLGRSLQVSMGMSGDFEVAVEEGATVVRVGTAIFGQRA